MQTKLNGEKEVGIIAHKAHGERAHAQPLKLVLRQQYMLVIFVLFICVFKLNRWEKSFFFFFFFFRIETSEKYKCLNDTAGFFGFQLLSRYEI